MKRYLTLILIIITIVTSCEEIIDIDLNTSDEGFVVEASVCKDSVSIVRLSRTVSYFSPEEPSYIEDATVIISDGTASEQLNYTGNGYYTGSAVRGVEERTYSIEIIHNGISYQGSSFMPREPLINSVSYSKSSSQSILNPFGETVFSIDCEFSDDINQDNYYLVRFSDSEGSLLERYYLLTEEKTNSGSIEYENGNISFSESIFYDGGEIEVKVFAVDEYIYNYFLQLTDVLFWKKRITPPATYNPASNINNGALGYFAAWSYDSQMLILE